MSKFINYAEVLYQNDKYITEDKIVRSTDGSKWSKQNIGIEVDGNEQSRNFIADPYFKIFDGINAANSKHITRIAINRPEYIIHVNEIWRLNSKQRTALITILNKTPGDSSKTIWQMILEACLDYTDDNELKRCNINKDEFLNKSIPDYTKLH